MEFKNNLEKIGFQKSINFDNIYLNDDSNIEYSDGQIELKIKDILSNLPCDKKNRFRILEDAIEDWPTEYHFNWVRQNILKPINFIGNEITLELGGGTGMLTEYLAEKSSQVISIEGTKNRAESISSRCSHLKNVNIIVSNFLELDLLKIFGLNKFDKIILVGVLEYVPKFAPKEMKSPIDNLLNVCNKLLKPTGEIVIAIENKIGLKYLLGWEEDHASLPNYGIESRYGKNDFITFTKEELKLKLINNQFKSISFMYPFPDYKLPEVIIRDCDEIYDTEQEKLIKNLLYGIKSRNYSGSGITPLVHEGRVFENFINNKSLDIVSNSFLVTAKKTVQSQENNNIPFLYYFSSKRKFAFANEMMFTSIKNKISVTKRWYGIKTVNNLLNHSGLTEFNYAFEKGDNLHNKLEFFYNQNNQFKYEVIFKKWIEFLKKQLPKYKGHTFDLLPYNTLLLNRNEEFLFFDTNEWTTLHDLSVSQLVKRYVDLNSKHFEWLLDDSRSTVDLFTRVCNYFNLDNLNKNDEEVLNELMQYVNQNILFQESYKQKQTLFVSKEINKWFLKKFFKGLTPPYLLRFFKITRKLLKI